MMWRLVIIGVVVHLLLLSAVFDIYFVSPVQQGMTPHRSGGIAPAKRLVLFVADGLRAESLYGPQMEKLAPFLHSIVENNGSWGVSHTQVPTESRPGHIAILAGFNEDPSAITRGWKYNPVEFDSVINESANAWCWGSPDIVDIFNREDLPHIHLDSYDAYMQDFSGQISPTILDFWVFDEVHKFFAKQMIKECTDFCENGNVMFLHLLGLDTAGHSFKPHSPEYVKNIEVVDEGIRKIENLFETYFGDNQTAYVFTADHGMTNWGSHGDGSKHETDVPFIAWGAGIVHNKMAQDLEQENIAALISSLIGINFPINSVGVVPTNFLNISLAQKAHIMHANARQLSEQYITKHLSLKSNTMPWLFQPFPEMSEQSFFEEMAELNNLVRNKFYQRAIDESYEAINLFKTGLKYYYNYYQNVLLLFVTIGFVGWIVFLFISINDLRTHNYTVCKNIAQDVFRNMWDIPSGLVGLILVVCLIPFAPSLPIKYYIYCLFPIFTWCMVLSNYKHGLVTATILATFSCKDFMYLMVSYIAEIELLIFTFFERYYLTILFIYLTYRDVRKRDSGFWFWTAGQFGLGLCPLLIDMQTTFSYKTQMISLAMWSYYGYKICTKQEHREDRPMLVLQFSMLVVAFANSAIVNLTLTYGKGLLLVNQLASWILLPSSLICPLFISKQLQSRVISAVVALMTPYTLMAVGHENLYMFFFALHMLNWLTMEHKLRKMKYPSTCLLEAYDTYEFFDFNYTDQSSVKRCFHLLAFIMLSYFGVGNTASLNSFDPMWARCFVTVFSPFTMTSIILIKLITPFLIVMCAFRGVMIINKAQVRNTFLIILLFCDLMVIQFLFYVKNEGSWLEIGVSLSRFIVVNVTTIFLLLLYQIALILTTKSLNWFPFIDKLTVRLGLSEQPNRHSV